MCIRDRPEEDRALEEPPRPHTLDAAAERDRERRPREKVDVIYWRKCDDESLERPTP